MKVIKYPTVKCDKCTCTYSFDELDIKVTNEIGYNTDHIPYTIHEEFVKCPICGHKFMIEPKKRN